MLAVGLGLMSQLPYAEGMSAALEKFLLGNLLPEKAGVVIAKYLGQFAHRAEGVTLVGIAALTATALMQMLTIEHAFNTIWKVRSPRPVLRRVAMHAVALLLGPVVFGATLAFTSYVASASFGLVNEPKWASAAFFRVLPVVFMAALFALLYWAVPNRTVSRWHALLGGGLAALGFLAMQRLFSLYVTNFPAYTVVYGAFAAIPIFLVWLYAFWGVILFGALVVAELGRGRSR
jgi:membrane protein